jgi:hypothetical protein
MIGVFLDATKLELNAVCGGLAKILGNIYRGNALALCWESSNKKKCESIVTKESKSAVR